MTVAKVEKPGYTNDASHLNETKVDSVVKAFEDVDKATAQISQLIRQAKEQGEKNINSRGSAFNGRAHDLR